METRVRAETSRKNKYWIDKDRFYELKHFCRQYPRWRRECSALDGLSKTQLDEIKSSNKNVGDPVYECVERRDRYHKCMDMVEQAALDTDTFLSGYILRGVTEGLSFTYLQTKLDIPCSKNTYYNLYRRFFWLLDKSRN